VALKPLIEGKAMTVIPFDSSSAEKELSARSKRKPSIAERRKKHQRDLLDKILSGVVDFDEEIKIAEGLHMAILGEAIAQGFSSSPLASAAEAHLNRLRTIRNRLVGSDKEGEPALA